MHLGAHAVNTARLYAISRISGVIGVVWAFFAGLFLFLGGGRRMTYPSWQPLLQFVDSVTNVPPSQGYRVVGMILIVGGALGVLGLMLTARWISLLSSVICTLWSVTVAGFLGMSNINVADGGNFLSVAITFIGLIYLLRFFLLVSNPDPGRAVQLYDRG